MLDKSMSATEAISSIKSGMTIGIGGWGSRRKPMTLIRELLRSDITDLTVVTLGGPEVGFLAKAGKIRKLLTGFVSLDSIPLDPLFTQAREAGLLEMEEFDEGMFVTGLRAAGARLDFLPMRAGLGSDVMAASPRLRTVQSPYSDDSYVAVPALNLDVALVHVNRADSAGNAQFLGPDPYFDDLFAMAAERTIVSTEKIVPTERLLDEGSFHTLLFSRIFVSSVVETPGGAHFTACEPDYDRDEAFQKHYVSAAREEDSWREFRETYLDVTEEEYRNAVKAFHASKGA